MDEKVRLEQNLVIFTCKKRGVGVVGVVVEGLCRSIDFH